jgi:acetyl-CoA carboxylase biotin carboxylase subunit
MKKVLVANRGEIAVRIVRELREMGMSSVSVYSKADRNCMHVWLADAAYYIGNSPAKESYLNFERILDAAKKSGADAIHPGYGFLSEDSNFIKACEDYGLKFVGPSSEAAYQLGDKINAKNLAFKLDIPTLGGKNEKVETWEEALSACQKLGFPVALKAAMGGGGKGIRIVTKEATLRDAFRDAQSEALKAFGDERLFIEKYIERARHIEVQILRDKQGNTRHLFERDCSLQKRRQKLVEEAPANLSAHLRERLCRDALRMVDEVGYTGAATVEFLVDAAENYYFLEVNTRIQVEHPVTEMITGVNLIQEQINIAFDKPVSFKQEDLTIQGHAIECRINAEDPFNNFMPSLGTIDKLHFPSGHGVRVDSAISEGDSITPFYDAMIAKLIAFDRNRDKALVKTLRALAETKLFGIQTSIPFLQLLLNDTDVRSGKTDTTRIYDFVAQMENSGEDESNREEILVAILAAAQHKQKFYNPRTAEFKERRQISRWAMTGRALDMRGGS